MRLKFLGVALGLLLALAACGRGEKADPAAEEQKIRAASTQWASVVGTKDAKAVVDFYAPDGVMMPAGAASIEGRDALTAAWQDLMAQPGFALSFETTKVGVAKSGDLAYETGTYELAFDGTDGPVKDKGKYTVVWKKVDGNWKAAVDIFNSDGHVK
ncbi:MAG: DUF4440 domain-containing protein [Alphaproteobacteria bacterium]